MPMDWVGFLPCIHRIYAVLPECDTTCRKQLPTASPFYASCAVSDAVSVATSVYQTLVVALVLSRLDYGNAVLVGLPAYLYNLLQSVLNAAARSIAGLRRSDHITDTLDSFHWLKAPVRVQYTVSQKNCANLFFARTLPNFDRLWKFLA